MGRFRTWLTDPSTRWRGRRAPAVVDPQLVPVTPQVEAAFARWVTDLVEGPVAADVAARGRWEAAGGPMAPSTFTIIVAALAAAAENAGQRWTPSAGFDRWRKGMKVRLSKIHEVRKATPLRLRELRTICDHIVGFVAPDLVRDTVVVELAAAGLGAAAIANLTAASVLRPEGGVTVPDAATNAQLWSATGKVGRPAAIVGGSLHTLSPAAVVAVDAYLVMRGPVDPHEPLLVLSGSNRRAHVRKILLRLARAVGATDWRPADGLSERLAEAMRAALGSGLLGRGEAKAVRDRALLLVGWAAALRRSELAALRTRDVTVVPDGLQVLVVGSKTDQLHKGTLLGVTAGAHPATDARGAVMAWVGVLRAAGFGPSDPLWPSLDRLGRPTGRAIDGADVSEIIRHWLRRSGAVPAAEVAGFSGHSLRRGFMTTAAEAGVPPMEIAKQSRHQSLDMVAAYVDEARLISTSVTAMLGL